MATVKRMEIFTKKKLLIGIRAKLHKNSRPGTFHLSLCRSRDAPQPERIIKLQNAAVNRSLIQREVYLKPETRDLSACGKRSRETSKSPRRRFLIVHKFWRGSAKCCRCRVRTREMRSAVLLSFSRRTRLQQIFLHLRRAERRKVYPFLRPQTLPNVNIIQL